METNNLTPEQIGNRKIAEFLCGGIATDGYKYSKKSWAVHLPQEFCDRINMFNPVVFVFGNELKFHKSFDWLMPIVEKIEAMHKGMAFEVVIRGGCCEIKQSTQHWIVYGDTGRYYEGDINEKGEVIKVIIDLPEIDERSEIKAIAVWLAIIQFIDWYNGQSNEVKKLCNL